MVLQSRRGSHNLALSAVGNDDRLGGLSALGSNLLDVLDDVHTFNNLSEDNVLSVQPCGLDSAQEELRSVGVRSGIGHGENTWSRVREGEVLISELGSVDGLAASSVTGREVTSLAHKFRDDTVKSGSLEVKGLSGLSHTLLASAQATEVFRGLGSSISLKLHNNATSGSSANRHIEENLRVGHLEQILLGLYRLSVKII